MFTGFDKSSFFGRGKKSAWAALLSYPDVTVYLDTHPYEPTHATSQHFLTLDIMLLINILSFVILALSQRVHTFCQYEARRDLFCIKSKTLENLPPTQNASLLWHAKRAVFQSSIL